MVRHRTAGVAAANVDLGVDVGSVAVLNRSTTGADVFVRTDGTNPTVEGDDCFVVPAGARRTILAEGNGNTVVRYIATAAGVKIEIEG